MLSVQNISLEIGSTKLLDDISFTIKSGELLTVIGPNGAGKSSLLKAIAQPLKQAGEVCLAGQPIDQISTQELAKQMAVLPQKTQLNFDFTVQEVVEMGRMPHSSGAATDKQLVQDVLVQMDIQYLANQPYTRLSGGEQQRVQLARVLAQIWRAEGQEHRLLLLDEPTAALDIAHQHQLMRVLKQLAQSGVAIIVVLHDFNLVARYVDTIAVLCCGQLKHYGSPNKVLTQDMFDQVFKVKAELLTHPTQSQPVVLINE